MPQLLLPIKYFDSIPKTFHEIKKELLTLEVNVEAFNKTNKECREGKWQIQPNYSVDAVIAVVIRIGELQEALSKTSIDMILNSLNFELDE